MNFIFLTTAFCKSLKASFTKWLLLFHLSSLSIISWAQAPVDLSSAEPILVYEVSHHLIHNKDTLKIQVFADGFVELHYPEYMKHAGDYSLQLPTETLHALIDYLESTDIQNFNEKNVGLQKKSTDKIRGKLSYISDSSVSSFQVQRKNPVNQRSFKQQIKCPHLQFDAKKFPNIKSLNNLAKIEMILKKLIIQPDVQELNNGAS